jgi:phosphoribosyl-ATP pyrophosphohydrolase
MLLQLTGDSAASQTDCHADHAELLNTMAADQRIIESDRRLVTKASLGDSLDRLWRVIDSRRNADPDTSYTAKLLMRGRRKAAQKLGEEAVEAVIEAVRHDNAALIGESADLLFHLLVLWAACGVTPAEVAAELAHREGTSGLDEKRNRKK